MLRRKKAKVGKTHCFTCFKMRLQLRWSTTIFSQLPHMRTTISPDLWITYIPMNRSTCILTLKESQKVVLRRKKAKVGKTHCFTCFKMRLHLRWSTTIFSQLPHMRTTISPDLWIVYIPMNRSTCILTLKESQKVVLRRKKAKVGKTHCFTCFKMRLHLRWSTTIFSQLPHMRTTISPDLWIVYIPMNRSTCILTLKESQKVVLRRKKAKVGKTTVSLASKCAYTCADLPRFSPNFHTCAQLYHPIFG